MKIKYIGADTTSDYRFAFIRYKEKEAAKFDKVREYATRSGYNHIDMFSDDTNIICAYILVEDKADYEEFLNVYKLAKKNI